MDPTEQKAQGRGHVTRLKVLYIRNEVIRALLAWLHSSVWHWGTWLRDSSARQVAGLAFPVIMLCRDPDTTISIPSPSPGIFSLQSCGTMHLYHQKAAIVDGLFRTQCALAPPPAWAGMC